MTCPIFFLVFLSCGERDRPTKSVGPPYCRGTFPSVRPTKCGSLPTPSQQHVCRRPQRQASITYADEVPQVKTENRETAALSRERAYAHVSLFPFFAFTSSPTCRKTVIHRSIGVKVLLKSLHILPISRSFFFNNPLLFKILLLFTTKMRNSINVCDRRNHCTVCFFRARVRSAPQRTALSFTAGCEAHFLPVGAHLNMADGANCYLEMG